MPATRKSSGALQAVDSNVPPPTTPGKQVKNLKAELDKKDAENKALLENIASLTNALNGMNIVKDNLPAEAPKNKKDKDAPVPAKTAYKFFCDENPKKDGVDMRQVWKECAPDIRAKFVAMAEADKARFQEENKAYEEEKKALEMYYEKKKTDMAMQFFEAHLSAQAALEQAENEKKGKKAKKDPEAPKRPTSSYMYFAMDKRESVTKQNPNAAPTEITKILGEMWNNLEKGKKGKNGTKKYDDMAAKDRTRYEAEKEEYEALVAERNAQSAQDKLDRLQQDKEEAMKLMKEVQEANAAMVAEMNPVSMDDMSEMTTESGKSNGKKKKDPNAPKRPSSAYIFFCTENRASIKAKMPETTTNAELLSEVGRQWKALTDKKKEKYNKMASKDKDRYAKEMEKYNATKQ